MKLKDLIPIYFESPTSGTTYTLLQTLELYFQTLKHTHTTNVLALTHVPVLLPRKPGDCPANSTENRLTNWHCHDGEVSKAVQQCTTKHKFPYYSKYSVAQIRKARLQLTRCLTNSNQSCKDCLQRTRCLTNLNLSQVSVQCILQQCTVCLTNINLAQGYLTVLLHLYCTRRAL